MTTTVEKIASGLDRRDHSKPIPLSALSGAPSSISDLNKLASQADLKRNRLTELAAGIAAAVEKYEKKAAAKWAETGVETSSDGFRHDVLGDTKRRKFLRNDIQEYRKNALAISADERANIREELAEIRQAINTVREMWSDPVAILMRATLADPHRSTYSANLAHSGPAEIEATLRHAVLTEDKALAAAALSRLDSMPRDSKKLVSISRQDVAEALVSEDWQQAKQMIAMVEIAAEEANIADDSAEGKTVSAPRKITLGAKKRELASMLGVDLNEETEESKTPQKPENSGKSLDDILAEKYPAIPGSGAS